MVFATISYASYLFISTILNCLVTEVNKTISNYKLLLNYCLRRAIKEINTKSWLITQGVKNCFHYSILNMLLFRYPSPSSFHYAISCWHFSLYCLYRSHHFHMLSYFKATLALLPLSPISSIILSIATQLSCNLYQQRLYFHVTSNENFNFKKWQWNN